MVDMDPKKAMGPRKKSNWVRINDFGLIPSEARIDENWLSTLKSDSLNDTVIEFQPLLARPEVDEVIYAIKDILDRLNIGSLKNSGTDFSGRQWIRGFLNKQILTKLAKTFFSIQSLHPPLWAYVSQHPGSNRIISNRVTIEPPDKLSDLPCVAVVEGGIRDDHPQLQNYKRRRYTDPDSVLALESSHASRVASRIVFGDREEHPDTQGICSFREVIVKEDYEHINEKIVSRAIDGAISSDSDVRVFNLSFDGREPLSHFDFQSKKNKLKLIQDLDNLIFARDIIAVIAAGNSPKNVTPRDQYPNHYEDPHWQLSYWARSFNSLTCGSYLTGSNAGDDVTIPHLGKPGWPSPFTRVGPGLVSSPKPDFSAPGGNLTPTFNFRPGLGVNSFDKNGNWDDSSGTSYSAPILAREAALAVDYLHRFCQQGARPYGAIVKAFLKLTAEPPVPYRRIKKLVKNSLGSGKASHIRLMNPKSESAVLLWQGVIENSRDKTIIEFPIPRSWIENAISPFLRLVIAWDTPVNAEIRNIWACRKVEAQFRPGPNAKALSSKGKGHQSYPSIDRVYDLKKMENVTGDSWFLEISYKEIADYIVGQTFDPQQRVGLAAELYDASDTPVSPQEFVQALPVASSMNRLSIPPVVMRTPIMLRTQV